MIELTYGISEIVNKEIEDGIMAEARATVGWNIDKQALIEAVEKATPKEPYLKQDDFGDGVMSCPTCKKSIVNVWSRKKYKPNYCHYCGQKLDWEVKDE